MKKIMNKFCPKCEKYRDVITKNVYETYKIHGVEIEVPILREECIFCGEHLGSDEQDKEILDFVKEEYCKKQKNN